MLLQKREGQTMEQRGMSSCDQAPYAPSSPSALRALSTLTTSIINHQQTVSQTPGAGSLVCLVIYSITNDEPSPSIFFQRMFTFFSRLLEHLCQPLLIYDLHRLNR
ncbi:hypothetical protein FGO68_gene9529 [Halteria grandinella]|uniref:Uncharacterized protein n=1 Tax=Halteria grandinella TaxID=5974 RepID=A0A8J8T336_HALGN|nr:hypothetical protein FGO68_gene9529 [Halteria grandinella]